MELLQAMERLHARCPELRLEYPMAENYLASGRPGAAKAICEAGLAAKPDYYQLYLTLGKLEEQEGHWYEAAAAFESALSACPENLLAARHLVSLFERIGRSAEISPLIARFPEVGSKESRLDADEQCPDASLSPGHSATLQTPFVNPTVAELYCSQGHVRKAIAIYEEIHRVQPDNREISRRLKELQTSAVQMEPS